MRSNRTSKSDRFLIGQTGDGFENQFECDGGHADEPDTREIPGKEGGRGSQEVFFAEFLLKIIAAHKGADHLENAHMRELTKTPHEAVHEHDGKAKD